MDGLRTFAEEWPNCLELPVGEATLRVLSTARILVSKRASNRPKDLLVIPVLEDSIRTEVALKKTSNSAGGEDKTK
jgi:hypothetical protein